jgi:hypothetical protein
MQERAPTADGAAEGEAKRARTEEELSPGTKALLCDEDVMPTAHVSSLSECDNSPNQPQNMRSFAARETSVLTEFAKNIKLLAVRMRIAGQRNRYSAPRTFPES